MILLKFHGNTFDSPRAQLGQAQAKLEVMVEDVVKVEHVVVVKV